jgi:hypothetical protein
MASVKAACWTCLCGHINIKDTNRCGSCGKLDVALGDSPAVAVPTPIASTASSSSSSPSPSPSSPSPGWFARFHAHLLYLMADFLSGHCFARLSCVNRSWRALERKERGRIWQRIVKHSYGALQLMVAMGSGTVVASLAQQQQRDGNEWRELYIRLVTHQMDWCGQAIDQSTDNFRPYPMRWLCRPPHHTMHVIPPRMRERIASLWQTHVSPGGPEEAIRNTDQKPLSFTGRLLWPSLNNGTTTTRTYTSWQRVMSYAMGPMAPRTGVTTTSTTTSSSSSDEKSSRDHTEQVTCRVESVWFREETVVRGHILVPNNYQAFIMGSGAVGAYTGTNGGVFWVHPMSLTHSRTYSLMCLSWLLCRIVSDGRRAETRIISNWY